jgi:hypothetical protein
MNFEPLKQYFDRPPRILFLYGSLRKRSYSRLLAEEAARIIEGFGRGDRRHGRGWY